MFPLMPTILLIIFIITMILLLEGYSTRLQSRSIQDLWQGTGNFFVLNTKQLLGVLGLSLAVLFYFTEPSTSRTLLEWSWEKNRSPINIMLAVVAAVIGYKTASGIQTKPRLHKPYSLPGYFLLRIIYLVLYEFFFRCLLLLFILQLSNWAFAILLNTLIYSLSHVFSGKKEMIGAIFFGSLLCLITLAQHTIWPAIIIHLLLALSHEIRLVFTPRVIVKSKWKTLFNN